MRLVVDIPTGVGMLLYMNSTDIQTMIEIANEGNAVRIDELGTTDPEIWDRNQRKAEKEGKEWCVHCGRAVDLNTAWTIRTTYGDKILFTVKPGFERQDIDTDWKLLGTTCGPKFAKEFGIPTEYLVPASKTIA